MRFEYELALALGKFLYELDAAPAEEIIRWKVYCKHYLIGDRRRDLHTGILAAQQAAIHGRRGSRPKVTDFMPYANDFRTGKEDWRETKRRLMEFAARQQARFDECQRRQRLG